MLVDEEADVPGADGARRLVADYRERGLRTTRIVAQAGSRFVTLSETVRRAAPDAVLDTDAIVDSLALD